MGPLDNRIQSDKMSLRTWIVGQLSSSRTTIKVARYLAMRPALRKITPTGQKLRYWRYKAYQRTLNILRKGALDGHHAQGLDHELSLRYRGVRPL